jgi:tetratricopeptide (TPR) repeat protein
MSPTRGSSRPAIDRRLLPAGLILLLTVAAIYGQTWRHGFLNYDDSVYILANPEVTRGLSWDGLRWAFGFHAANWHPLTWLSHMLDCQLFGLAAGGHHLVSAALHAANALLVLSLLRGLTGNLWTSAAAAALFAVHPLRVESVAWAAERKDVLAALLMLLTLALWLRYVRRPRLGSYLAALGLFGLALAAKATPVTLPFLLLLLDGWPLGRNLAFAGRHTEPAAAVGRRGWGLLLAEKLPFLALALAASAVTLRAQTTGVVAMAGSDPTQRLGNAALAYVAYLGSFLWPHGLAPLYPYPRAGISWTAVATALVLLALLSAGALLAVRRRPYLAVGWLWYLGMLVPVIGLVQVGAQARSDRYTYLSQIGVTIALLWLLRDLWPARPWKRAALAAACGGALLTLADRSHAYVRVWRDDLSLFSAATAATPGNTVMLNNLAGALRAAGRSGEAIRTLEETVRIDPGYCKALSNLGIMLVGLQRCPEALGPLERALACAAREPLKTIDEGNIRAALSRCGRP